MLIALNVFLGFIPQSTMPNNGHTKVDRLMRTESFDKICTFVFLTYSYESLYK